MKAIIIDDEAKARRLLKSLLEEHCPEVDVIEMVNDVPSAVKAIHKDVPDLIFLDIEMPGYTGFQLLDFFENVDFDIIFTTAYSDYAIKAFEVSAIAYLLKPIQIDKLKLAVEKHKYKKGEQRKEKMEALKLNLSDNKITKIALPVSDGYLFVKPEEIIYLKAESAYTNIFLANGSNILVSKSLKEFEKLIVHPHFTRVHRSYFINLQNVKQYVRSEGGHLEMDNGDVVYFSKDKKEELITFFEQMKG